MSKNILSLDLASQFGWAEGKAGEPPRFGSQRFAPVGASTEEIFAGVIRVVTPRLASFRPDALVYEEPSLFQLRDGKSTKHIAKILLGIPAIVEGLAKHFGVPIIREASPRDVRKHFIGNGQLPRAKAKAAVVAECKRRGWDVKNDDEGDACAIYDYAAACLG